jgi:flavin reductase (DIM6/NTAB) family NADH-FMN oxidoreductase RutF
MTIDADKFRTAMRHLAGHVCLITTVDKNGKRNGLTATAVCSVSADPPTILCCVNRSNASYTAITKDKNFAVNVLSLEDKDLANRFASRIRGEERYSEGSWKVLTTGAPILESALASLDCTLSNAVDVNSHGILFGEIQAVQVKDQDAAKPLLYAQGSYGEFSSIQDKAQDLWIPHWDLGDDY